MDSNRCSPEGTERPPGSPPDRLAALAAVVEALATDDLDRQPDAALTDQTPTLRLADALEGQCSGAWPPWTPAAPPAPTTTPAAATASWLRGRLHTGATTATPGHRTHPPHRRHPTAA
jgi:hypothetical protein